MGSCSAASTCVGEPAAWAQQLGILGRPRLTATRTGTHVEAALPRRTGRDEKLLEATHAPPDVRLRPSTLKVLRSSIEVGPTRDRMSNEQPPVGAVAMIDALGWKGIWRRISNLQRFLSNIQAVETRAKRRAPKTRARLKSGFWGPTEGWNSQSSFEVRFLSDTVVVAASLIPPQPDHIVTRDIPASALVRQAGLLVQHLVVESVAEIVRHAASASPPLIYRGAIATGAVHIYRNILLGAAVDRAAELMDLPDGAFIWVDPKEKRFTGTGILEMPIPLRDGRRIHSRVVNPFHACGSEQDIREVSNGYNSTLHQDGGSLDIIFKRQHTELLLDAGTSAMRERLPRASVASSKP